MKFFKESELAHKYLDGLKGVEIGGSAHNPFGLNTLNVDVTDSLETIYKRDERKICGECLGVDIIAPGDELPLDDCSTDFVISSHVLEHFYDPIKALKEWYRVTKVGGYIFMIIPHKERTFDKDRSRTTLSELLRRHQSGDVEVDPGLSDDYSDGDRLDMHFSVWITEDVVELINFLGWELVEVHDKDDKVGNGFTIVIKKRELNNKKNVFYYSNEHPSSGSFYYRAVNHIQHSDKYNFFSNIDFDNVCYLSNDRISFGLFISDIVVFVRPVSAGEISLVAMLKKMGKIIIVDYDDNFLSLDSKNPNYYLKGKVGDISKFFLEQAHAVTASTSNLARSFSKINSNVYAIKNLIDIDFFSKQGETFQKIEKQGIRIGITGSASSVENIEHIIGSLRDFQEKYDDVTFVFMTDKISENFLRSHFKKGVEFHEKVSFQRYPNKIRSLNLDMALIPRADNSFNSQKSNCKFLEFASLKIPVVAQGFDKEGFPYEDIEDGVTGFLAYSSKEWYEKMELLLEKNLNTKISNNAYNYVQSRYGVDHVNEWEEIMKKIEKSHKKTSVSVINFTQENLLECLNDLTHEKQKDVIHNRDEQIQKQKDVIHNRDEQIQKQKDVIHNRECSIKDKQKELDLVKSSSFWALRTHYIHYKKSFKSLLVKPTLIFKFFSKRYKKYSLDQKFSFGKNENNKSYLESVNMIEGAKPIRVDKSRVSNKTVEIIFVRFNNKKIEDRAISLVKKHTKHPFKLTIYDNYPKNEGLSTVWNRLIAESDCDYICLLNTDAFVSRGWLEKMMKGFEVSGVAAISPSSNNAKGQVCNKGEIYKDTFLPMKTLSGFCFLIKRDLPFVFPEQVPFYGGEHAWCIQALRHGYKLLWSQGVWVEHLEASSAKKKGNLKKLIGERNSQFYGWLASITPVLFVTYDRLEYTKKSLKKLLESNCGKIIIIDNGSTDGTREYLESIEDARVEVILNLENRGIGGAMSQFFEITKNEQYVGKVDNDTLVSVDWLEILLEKIDKHNLVAIQAKHPIMSTKHNSFEEWMQDLSELSDGVYLSPFIGGSGVAFNRSLIKSSMPKTKWVLGGWSDYQKKFPGIRVAFCSKTEIALLDMKTDNVMRYEKYVDYYKKTERYDWHGRS